MTNAFQDFEWRRTGMLIRRFAAEDSDRLLPAAIGYAMIYLAATAGLQVFGGAAGIAWLLFRLALAGGWIFTAAGFSRIHDKLAAPFALMLPASTAEKLAARWMISAVAYLAGVILLTLLLEQVSYLLRAYVVAPWLARGFVHLEVNGQPMRFDAVTWTLFPGSIVEPALVYLGLQPLFLWGGLRFASSGFIKTVILLGGGALLYWLFTVVLHNGIWVWSDSAHLSTIATERVNSIATLASSIGFWTLAAAGSLVLAYRRLRDAQG